MTSQISSRWVLVPGTLCTPDVFWPVLDHMGVEPENRHCIDVSAPNLRDYDAPLRAAVTGGEVVCGFSLGAMIIAHNLGALSRAKAIVLLACNPFPDAIGNRKNRNLVRDRILAGDARAWVSENWGAMSNDPSETLKERVTTMAICTSHCISAQTELAATRPGAAEQLKTTKLPLIFVTGEKDKLTPPDPIRPVVKASQHGALRVLEGLGHFALLEAPGRVAVAIQEGLRAVLPPDTSEN